MRSGEKAGGVCRLRRVSGGEMAAARRCIRQTLAALRTRKCLLIRSSKPFAENAFRAFKGLREGADTVSDP